MFVTSETFPFLYAYFKIDQIPVLDGSAALWVKAILNAGITDALDAEGNTVMRNVRILKEPIEIVDGDSYVKAIPSSSVKFMYEIDFPQVHLFFVMA